MYLKVAAFLCVFVIATETRHSRILDGSEAKPHEFPHMVTLDRKFSPHHFCGGAILNESWVVTAGHCLSLVPSGQTFRIKAGKHSLSTVEKSEQVINVAKTIVHEEYAGDVAPNDIALLKLEKPLVFNEYVQPIALPESGSKVDGQVIFSGWGALEYGFFPDVLQKGLLFAMDFNECKKLDELITGPPSPVTDKMLCAASLSIGNATFACPGDSGGPLIKQENRQIRLVGIYSWGSNPCGTLFAPSVFTSVSSYVEWIQNTIAYN